MKKSNLLDRTRTPDGKTVDLYEHDGHYTIRVNGLDLMSTRQFSSEEKLAEFGCAALSEKRGGRVLLGGLGFGFTLKAALRVLPPDSTVVVAEILAAVLHWNSDPNLPLCAEALNDPRVEVQREDVAHIINRECGGFDAILLDVDNGPDAFTTDGNQSLYGQAGLLRAKRALRRGGCLALWSASDDSHFEDEMKDAGFDVDVKNVRARPDAGSWHTLFLGWI